MKILLFCLFTQLAFAQDSKLLEENKNLKEENKMLREEIKKLQNPAPNPVKSQQMMDALKRGQNYQEDQLKALEDLEKED